MLRTKARMKVLLTGHLGYIGPMMVRAFRARGHFVVGFDTGFFRECIDDDTRAISPDHEIVKDVRRVDADDLAGLDAIVHLAALSNDPLGELDPALTADINTKATAHLARLAKAAGVKRFIFASSCSAYGTAVADTPLDENAEVRPVSAYAVSKIETEAALSALADQSFSPTYLRNATAYGVSPRMRFDLVLNNLMGWARTAGIVRVLSDGTPWRPLVHIEDIAEAALCAAESPLEAVHDQAFNIGRNDANYRVRDIAEAVARAVPGARFEIVGGSGGDQRSYRVDFSKALRSLPGFAPRWTLEAGCEELNRWFDRHPATLDFQSRFYVRLKQLLHLKERGAVDADLMWRSQAVSIAG
jgi:nucleoside-diphosphate-sugar epimerase